MNCQSYGSTARLSLINWHFYKYKILLRGTSIPFHLRVLFSRTLKKLYYSIERNEKEVSTICFEETVLEKGKSGLRKKIGTKIITSLYPVFFL